MSGPRRSTVSTHADRLPLPPASLRPATARRHGQGDERRRRRRRNPARAHRHADARGRRRNPHRRSRPWQRPHQACSRAAMAVSAIRISRARRTAPRATPARASRAKKKPSSSSSSPDRRHPVDRPAQAQASRPSCRASPRRARRSRTIPSARSTRSSAWCAPARPISSSPTCLAGSRARTKAQKLGDKFLGHAERCNAILHLIDGTESEIAWLF